MINLIKAYVADPALPSRLLDTLFVGLIIAGTLWMLQLFWRQIRSLPTYIATSRKKRRHQNYIEIRRRIENDEYLILMEEDSIQIWFVVFLLLLMNILAVVLQSAIQVAVPLDLAFALVVVTFLSAVVIFLIYGILLSNRNRAARLHRAGMRRNKKTGALERRRPAHTGGPRPAQDDSKVHDSGVRHGRDP